MTVNSTIFFVMVLLLTCDYIFKLVLNRHCRHHQACVQKVKKNNNIHYILLESAEALNFL